jgi:dTDP-4-dehydrorhamnose 3,5-epimerase
MYAVGRFFRAQLRATMQFKPGVIQGLHWHPLNTYHDSRGWLCELFRDDELAAIFNPVMAYISMTQPGVARGPHEHIDQTDVFCFLGPSNFKIYLWDRRPESPTCGIKQTEIVGIDRPMRLIVPPGIVHAYKNVGSEPGLVFNCPNRLYKGPGRKEPVDEVRHEEDASSAYVLD